MGHHRKDDVRIYVISGLFFACSTGGGILLCLYIFLPHSQSQGVSAWLSIVGLVLVAIPWIVWFLIYSYRCFRPMANNNVAQFHERRNDGKPTGGTPKSAEVVASPCGGGGQESPFHSPVGPDDGGRHVHFGEVVVVGNRAGGSGSGSGGGQRRQHEAVVDCREEALDESLADEEAKEAMETEMPLTSATDRSSCITW